MRTCIIENEPDPASRRAGKTEGSMQRKGNERVRFGQSDGPDTVSKISDTSTCLPKRDPEKIGTWVERKIDT